MRFIVRRNVDRLERLVADRTQYRVRLDTLEKITDSLKQQDAHLGQEIRVVEKKLGERMTSISETFQRDIQRNNEAMNAELERQVARLDRLDALQDKKHAQLQQDFDALQQGYSTLKRRLVECEERNKKLEKRVNELMPQNEILEQKVESLNRQLRFVINRLTRPLLMPEDVERIAGMMTRPRLDQAKDEKTIKTNRG